MLQTKLIRYPAVAASAVFMLPIWSALRFSVSCSAERNVKILFAPAHGDEDQMSCLRENGLSRVFCRTSAQNQHDLFDTLNIVKSCEWTLRAKTCLDCDFNWYKRQVASNAYVPERFEHEVISIHARSPDFDSTETIFSDTAQDHEVRDANLEFCKIQPEGPSTWTFERMGTFLGTGGHDWHHFVWNNAGRFREELLLGQIWVTYYAFFPLDDRNTPLGVPPIHIHHEHVTSSQDSFDYYRGNIFGRVNEFGTVGVEFDVHGDRQCLSSQGGVSCLPVKVPNGFGMRILYPMQTFGDLNDIRPLNSPPLNFSILHAYQWSRTAQRQVGRLVTGIGAGAFRKPGPIKHDTALLIFDPHAQQMTEYMMWGELSFAPYNLTIFSHFFHTHHAFTADIWILRGHKSNYCLEDYPFEGHNLNLTSHDMTIGDAMKYVLSCMRSKLENGSTVPKLLCSMEQDRWEDVGGYYQERKRMARCGGAFTLQANEVVTMMSFHKPLTKITEIVYESQHVAWYAYYTGFPPERIPPSIYAKVVPPYSGLRTMH